MPYRLHLSSPDVTSIARDMRRYPGSKILLLALVVTLSACSQATTSNVEPDPDPGSAPTNSVASNATSEGDPLDSATFEPRSAAGEPIVSGSDWLPPGRYRFEVTRYVGPTVIPGFGGGYAEPAEEILTVRGTGPERSVRRMGSYWGPYVSYEDELARTGLGAALAVRIQHYQDTNTGDWRRQTCVARSPALAWPSSDPSGDRWNSFLRCSDSDVRFDLSMSWLGRQKLDVLGESRDVIVIQTEVRRFFDPPRPHHESAMTVTEWTVPGTGLLVRWRRVTRDAAGEIAKRDVGALTSVEPLG